MGYADARNAKISCGLFVKKTEPEHANIKRAIEHHSDGDYQHALTHAGPRPDLPFVIAYLFTSGTDAREMGFGLLNGDNVIVVEVGDNFQVIGSSMAEQWLRNHRSSSR